MTVTDRTSSEFQAYLELYERAPLLELGQLADAERWRQHPENAVTYIIDRNINYTNVCVADCGFCAFYRRPQARRGLRPVLRADRRQDRRVQGDRRRPDPDAGRAQPVHPVRVVPRPDALHQAQPPDPHPRLLAERGRLLQRALRPRCARRHPRAAGGGARLDSRRRRRDPGARVRERVAKKKAQTGVARDHGGGAPAGHEDLGHDDVRPRRDPRRPARAPAPRARGAGAHRRLHRVHLLAAPAREHAGDVAQAEDRRRRPICARSRSPASCSTTCPTCSRAG